MSELTGEAPEHIWRTKGNVLLTAAEEGFVVVNLGLRHDPCVYLTPEGRCGVYEKRPTTCAGFPFLDNAAEPFLTGTGPTSKNVRKNVSHAYRCLHSIQFSAAQTRAGQELYSLMMEEEEAMLRTFWKGEQPIIPCSTVDDVLGLYLTAHRVQAHRDPKGVDELSNRLHTARPIIQQAPSTIQEQMGGTQQVQQLTFSYINAFEVVVYALYQDDIAEHFAHLDRNARIDFQRFDKERKKILRRLEEDQKQLARLRIIR